MDIYYNKNKLVQFVEGRVFVDVAYEGCGSDCIYCYVDTKALPQKTVGIDDFYTLLSAIVNEKSFEIGKSGTIISLCPNTEPFKTDESTQLVLELIKKFLPLGNQIQISTKEVVPRDIITYIVSRRIYETQVLLDISTSSISEQTYIEPFAEDISSRLNNFVELGRNRILSCLYIKPVINQTISDINIYMDIVKKYNIKFVCIGLYYPEIKDKDTCKTLYLGKDVFDKVKLLPTFKTFKQFIEIFHTSTDCVIVHSTICIFSIINNVRPRIPIWKDYPEICSKCRNCEKH